MPGVVTAITVTSRGHYRSTGAKPSALPTPPAVSAGLKLNLNGSRRPHRPDLDVATVPFIPAAIYVGVPGEGVFRSDDFGGN